MTHDSTNLPLTAGEGEVIIACVQLNATIGEASRMMAQKERSNRTEQNRVKGREREQEILERENS